MSRWALAAWAMILGGLGFRIWGGGHAQINFDQAWFWTIGVDISNLTRFPAFGSVITGTEARVPSPLFHYVTALPHLISDHPRAGSTFFSLMHAGAAALLFWMARSLVSARMGFFVVALWAFAPWEVLYGDSIWLSNIAPVYGVVITAAALAAQKSARAQTALVILAFAGPAMHLSLPVAWIGAAVVLVFRRPEEINRRSIAIGIAVGLLFFIPSMIVDAVNGFSNTQAVFNKALGDPPPGGALRSAAQTPIYAVLFGTSEMGYFFERGYWGGRFDAHAAYLSLAGWKTRLATMSDAAAYGTAISVATSAVAWCTAGALTLRAVLIWIKDKRQQELHGAAVVMLACVATLFVCFALLFAGKKLFFPHYITMAAPFCLWPLAWSFDALIERQPKLLVPALFLVGACALSMFTNTARYYKNVSSLNGLNTTLALAEWVAEEQTPIELNFRHFNNAWAVNALAERHFGKRPHVLKRAPVRFDVQNGSPTSEDGALEPGERRLGAAPILVRRTERSTKRPPGSIFHARENYRKAKVTAITKDGRRDCRYEATMCRYGGNPWERYSPEFLPMGGGQEAILFMHPIADGRLVATYPLPAETQRGLLYFGLSDPATQSGNKAPVNIRILQGEQTVGRAQATNNRPGLRRLPFTVTTTGARTLSVELTTDNPGARVFGFDLDLFAK